MCSLRSPPRAWPLLQSLRGSAPADAIPRLAPGGSAAAPPESPPPVVELGLHRTCSFLLAARVLRQHGKLLEGLGAIADSPSPLAERGPEGEVFAEDQTRCRD